MSDFPTGTVTFLMTDVEGSMVKALDDARRASEAE